MLSPRLLAQLADVATRDARAAVDPSATDSLTELPAPPRIIAAEDWERADFLERLSHCQWTAAVAEGWDPIGCPWLSDDENEQIRVAFWDRILP